MDRSVYTPGAGHLPPVLAGRDSILREWQLTLNDVAAVGRTRARDLILTGPRGVGKTATLTTFGSLAAQAGFETVTLQAVAGHAGLVASLLQRAAVRVEQGSGAWARAKRAFDRIESINLGAAGISAGLSRRTGGSSGPVPVLDPSTLAEALVTLVREIRAEQPHGGLLVTVDEMQVASPADLALLAATLHRLNVDHPSSAVVFAGTGLPHTPEALRSAGVTTRTGCSCSSRCRSLSTARTRSSPSSSRPAAAESCGTRTPPRRWRRSATATRRICSPSRTPCGLQRRDRTWSPSPTRTRPSPRPPARSNGARSGLAGTG